MQNIEFINLLMNIPETIKTGMNNQLITFCSLLENINEIKRFDYHDLNQMLNYLADNNKSDLKLYQYYKVTRSIVTRLINVDGIYLGFIPDKASSAPKFSASADNNKNGGLYIFYIEMPLLDNIFYTSQLENIKEI